MSGRLEGGSMVAVNVVVLAGTVSADPVERRMPSGDEVAERRPAEESFTSKVEHLADVRTRGTDGSFGVGPERQRPSDAPSRLPATTSDDSYAD
jgi:hypothetical protein